MFRETDSEAKQDRAQFARLLKEVEHGDVVVVMRLDRLARSTRNLLNVLGSLAERSAMFRSLGGAWADTTTPHGRLMLAVLAVLAGLAEFERELIWARVKVEGRKMGRPHKLTPHPQREARERRDGDGSLSSIARSYNVHHATISAVRELR